MPGAMAAFLASITRSSIVLLNCFTKLEREEEMLLKDWKTENGIFANLLSYRN
jgi:hypothetical protein